ncbi:DUF1015 domain-containing protein [Pelagibacterales bacterium SAG-MED46]|nr:DUF1015 domain-containing protein [Pelagibacterales bacterium SAG-MED46]
MSLIKPFSGIRPKKKFAKQVTSPNLSYINNYKLTKKINFLNLLNTSNINKSKKMLQSLYDNDIIQQDQSNHFYLYRITYSKKKLLGIVGKINLDNYDDKKILGHEETFVKRIKKRKEQLLKFNSQISPIYTTYKSNPNSLKKLNNFFRFKPDYNFKSEDKCRHELWVIKKSNIEKLLLNYLKNIKKIYICDGHHRIQAMLKSKKKIAPMVIAFPENQVNILDYNRVIKTSMKFEKIVKIISKYFSINTSKKNNKLKQNQIEMYVNNKWYMIKPFKKSKELDVTLLRKLILNKILNNKKNIDFVSGFKGKKALENLVNSKKYDLAFRLYPTNILQVLSIAEKKKYMPQKSTWFHPKPLDGLISSRIIS